MSKILAIQSPGGEVHYCNNLSQDIENNNLNDQETGLERIQDTDISDETIHSEYTREEMQEILQNLAYVSTMTIPVRIICILDIIKYIIASYNYVSYEYNNYNSIISILELLITLNSYYATFRLKKMQFLPYLILYYMNVGYDIYIYTIYNISIHDKRLQKNVIFMINRQTNYTVNKYNNINSLDYNIDDSREHSADYSIYRYFDKEHTISFNIYYLCLIFINLSLLTFLHKYYNYIPKYKIIRLLNNSIV
tara:strand:- start:3883 stop:4635 length:753 start_codon:yes stop_codon:yes gene_type:complete